jgi:hypothetical protein
MDDVLALSIHQNVRHLCDSLSPKEDEVRDFLQRLLQGRYVGLLEGEVARLRAENRALTNSLLGTAGFPPVDYPEPAKPQPLPRLRKRSWHQIQAWREAGAARDSEMNFEGREEAKTNGPVSHS